MYIFNRHCRHLQKINFTCHESGREFLKLRNLVRVTGLPHKVIWHTLAHIENVPPSFNHLTIFKASHNSQKKFSFTPPTTTSLQMKSTALALSIVLAASLKSTDAFTPQGVPSKGNKPSSEIAYKSGTDTTDLTATEQKQMKLKRIIENQKNLYANKSPWRVTRPATQPEDDTEQLIQAEQVAEVVDEDVDMDLGALSLLESKDVKAYIKHLKAKREKDQVQEDTTRIPEFPSPSPAKPSKDIEIKVNTFGANARISTTPPEKKIVIPPQAQDRQDSENTIRARPSSDKAPPGRTWLSAAEKIKMAREAAKSKQMIDVTTTVMDEKKDTTDEITVPKAKEHHSSLEINTKNEKSEEEIAAALKEKMIQEYIAHLEEKRRKNGEKIEEKSVVVKQGAGRVIEEEPTFDVKVESQDDNIKSVFEPTEKNNTDAPKKSKSSKEIDELKNLLNSLVQRTDKFLDEPEGMKSRSSSNFHVESHSQVFPTIIEGSNESVTASQIQNQPKEKHWTELVSQPILFRSMDMIGKPLSAGELAQIKAQQERRKQRTQHGQSAQQQQVPVAANEMKVPVAQAQLRNPKNQAQTSRNPGHDYSTSFDQRMGLNPNQEPMQNAPKQRNTSPGRNPGLDYTTSFDQRMGLNPNQGPIQKPSNQRSASKNPGYDYNTSFDQRMCLNPNQDSVQKETRASRNPAHDYTTSFDQRMGLNPDQDSIKKKMRANVASNPGHDYTTSFDQRMGLNPLGSETRRPNQNVQFKTVNQLDMNGNPISSNANRRNPSHDYSTSFDQRVGGFAGRPTESYGFPQTVEVPAEELSEDIAFPNFKEEKAQRDAEDIMKEKLIQEYIALLKERRDKEQEKKEKPPANESKKTKGSIFHFKTLSEEPRAENW